VQTRQPAAHPTTLMSSQAQRSQPAERLTSRWIRGIMHLYLCILGTRTAHAEDMQDFRKGSTALLVLHVLADEPMYGFQLVEALRARTGGVLDFAEGMLYPMLHKLERAGLLAAEWQPGADGPPRKYYHLTPAGRDELERRRAEWTRFADAVDAALGLSRR
jgi:PadR family transcriptional regulator, regulatory protein PadR